MYHSYERRSNERISQELFDAIVDRAARRAAESDEIFHTLYRRICQQIGAAVIAKGSAVFGAICIVYTIANWKAIAVWIS